MIDADQPFEILGILNGNTLSAQGEMATISIVQAINGNEQTTIYYVSSSAAASSFRFCF